MKKFLILGVFAMLAIVSCKEKTAEAVVEEQLEAVEEQLEAVEEATEAVEEAATEAVEAIDSTVQAN